MALGKCYEACSFYTVKQMEPSIMPLQKGSKSESAKIRYIMILYTL